MEEQEYCGNCGAEIDLGYDCPCADYNKTSGDSFQEVYDLYANEY